MKILQPAAVSCSPIPPSDSVRRAGKYTCIHWEMHVNASAGLLWLRPELRMACRGTACFCTLHPLIPTNELISFHNFLTNTHLLNIYWFSLFPLLARNMRRYQSCFQGMSYLKSWESCQRRYKVRNEEVLFERVALHSSGLIKILGVCNKGWWSSWSPCDI